MVGATRGLKLRGVQPVALEHNATPGSPQLARQSQWALKPPPGGKGAKPGPPGPREPARLPRAQADDLQPDRASALPELKTMSREKSRSTPIPKDEIHTIVLSGGNGAGATIKSSDFDSRGTCTVCFKPVLLTQERLQNADGTYRHRGCVPAQ